MASKKNSRATKTSSKASSKKTASKKTSAIHIALGGSNAAVCGARGRTTVLVDEVTCPECRKIAAHAAAKARVSAEDAHSAEAASAAPGNEAADATAEPIAMPHEPTSAATKASAGPVERDPRLPPPGTVLRKLDRHGAVRCECTVTADGVEYKGETFRSLSGAAMAAAKDLNISGSQNGYLFFGLVKQEARLKNPIQAVEKAWDRYSARVNAIGAADLDAGMKRELAQLLESQGQKIVQVADAIGQSE